MIDVFTPKRISPGCLFKSNQRQVKILILFPQCAISPRYDGHRGDHLHGVLLTAEIVSVVCTEIISEVWCTLQRWSPRYVAHRGDDLCGMSHSAVGCTLRRSSPRWDAHRGDNFVIECLGEIKTKFENTSLGPNGFESRKRTEGRKSRNPLPLRGLVFSKLL